MPTVTVVGHYCCQPINQLTVSDGSVVSRPPWRQRKWRQTAMTSVNRACVPRHLASSYRPPSPSDLALIRAPTKPHAYLVPFIKQSSIGPASIYFPVPLAFNAPTERFPWKHLRKILYGGQGIAKVHSGENVVERFNPWLGCINVTDMSVAPWVDRGHMFP